MSPTEINMIISRLDRIDNRLTKLKDDAVTWKQLLGALTVGAAVITAAVTVGTALWG